VRFYDFFDCRAWVEVLCCHCGKGRGGRGIG
jgi:hypothetical protein